MVIIARVKEPVRQSSYQPAGLMARLGLRILDGGHHVAAVRRNLRHESQARLRVHLAGKLRPRDHVLRAHRHFLRHGHQRVQPLVVLRTVHVQSQRLAVAAERMAVGARMQVRHHYMARRLRNIAHAPLNQWNRAGSQRLDYTLLRCRWHQRHIPIEERRSHRVARNGKLHDPARKRFSSIRFRIAANADRGSMIHRVLADGRPYCRVGLPCMRSRLFSCKGGQLVVG